MAVNIYYMIDSEGNLHYCNEQKTGYSMRPNGNQSLASGRHVIVELTDGKFILPSDSSYLFYGATNEEFTNSRKWVTDYVTWDSSSSSSTGGFMYAFAQCSNLKYLDATGWNVYYIKNFSYMFSHCSSMEWLSVMGWDMRILQYCMMMFRGCRNLKNVYADPNTSWRTSSLQENGDYFMFWECSLPGGAVWEDKQIYHANNLGYASSSFSVGRRTYEYRIFLRGLD